MRAQEAEPDATTDPAADLVDRLTDLVRVTRTVEAVTAEARCTRLQLAILGLLVRTGPRRLTDIAEEVGIDLSAVSRQATALTESGLIGRERDAEDRRAWRVSATEAGRRQLDAVAQRRQEWVRRTLAGWSDADIRTAAGVLGAIIDEWRRSNTAG